VLESDLNLPQQGNTEFIEKCRKIQRKINSMILKPWIYLHDAEMLVKNIIIKSCEIQNCYEIEASTIINDFILLIKLQAHIIYLLSIVSYDCTGRYIPETTIKNQIENIWKASAIINNETLIKKCHDSYNNISSDIYDTFLPELAPVQLPNSYMLKATKKTAEITFPVGEKVVNECDVLSIQGHGSQSLYCVLEMPDGSVESAKANFHSNYLSSFIRIHRPNTPVTAQICFAVLLNPSDFVYGPGLYHETLKISRYIPVSNYNTLLLKPSSNN
jgi:hypothetical protein